MRTKFSISAAGLDHDFCQVISGVISRRLAERAGAACVQEPDAYRICLAFDASLHGDGYRISDCDGGVLIESDSRCGLLAGFGRFMRDCTLHPLRGFEPGAFRGEETPEKPFRGIYYATHFHNFYHDGPLEEVYRVLEDSALWGQNVLCAWYDYHHFTGVEDPASVGQIERMKAIYGHAKRLGIKTLLLTLANEMFMNSPEELRAEWLPQGDYFRKLVGHFHMEVCPSKPGGIEAIVRDHEAVMQAFADMEPDYFLIWPYDQGGCTCSECSPWGANGYLKAVNALRPLKEKYFPHAQCVLSGWFFDRFIRGEWEAFRAAMEEGNYREWIAYVAAFFPERGVIPEFIRQEKSVGGIPMIDFPEISMYGAEPWGGFGANPTPKMFTNIWARTAQFLQGGFSYSEGIFEEMNKATMLSFYNGRLTNGMDIVREYARTEFSPELAEQIAEIIDLMEETIVRVRVNEQNPPEGKTNYRFVLNFPQNVDYIFDCASKVDAQLDPVTRAGWRWRIIWLRAAIDHELVHSDYYISPRCEAYLTELTGIYHAHNADYVVAPPLPAAVKAHRGIA